MGKKSPRSTSPSSTSSSTSSAPHVLSSVSAGPKADKCLALAASIDLTTMAVPRTVSPASSRPPSRQDSSSSSSLLNDSGLALSRRQSDGSSCSNLDLSADPTDEAYAYHRRAAAELNNCAVALLEASQPREAVEAFGEAIRAAKRAHSILEDKAAAASSANDSVSSLDSDDDSAVISLTALGEGITESCDAKMRAHASLDAALLQNHTSSNHDDDASTGTNASTSATGSTGGSQRDALQRGLCGSRGLMAYTQPLRLDASQSNLTAGRGHKDIEGEETEARLSSGRRDLAVIMFNMALTHHIRGCQTSSDKSFKKALTSYNIAHSVFCQSRLASGAAVANKHEGRDELLRTALLNLALLNNMGQIISELGQDDVARQYFDGLSRLIGGTNEDGGDDDVTDAASAAVKRCWDGFEMNVLFSLSCPSPAA